MSEDIVAALELLGLDPSEAREAVAADRVALALVAPLLKRDRVFSTGEAAARLHVDSDYLLARDRALGVPPDMGYSEQEIAELGALPDLFQLLSPDAVLRSMRSDAQALTRIAMSNLQLVNAEVATPLREDGGGDIAVALALAETARALLPETIPLLASSFRRILTHLVSTEIVAAGSRAVDGDMPVAVGFADVVGYTSLSARVDPEGLDDVLTAFELLCHRVAADHGDVQLVKFLGDAVMYVGSHAGALAATLLDVVTAPEYEPVLEGTPMRAGMAYGPVLMRGGDYFGPTVNLAARLTDHARPGALLADDHLRDDLAAFDTRRTPPMRLRGLGVRRPIRVRAPRDGS